MNPLSLTASGAPSNTTTTTTQTAAPTVDKNMFLQLLVAQLRNQDPMNPSDSSQFVGQLAQFQQLENSENMGQDITAIRQQIDAFAAVWNPTAASSQS
jgi:flagellar basal-body rod modification protein FlgD